jgi:hypothetical protein
MVAVVVVGIRSIWFEADPAGIFTGNWGIMRFWVNSWDMRFRPQVAAEILPATGRYLLLGD